MAKMRNNREKLNVKLEKKRAKEARIVEVMIGVYCRGCHRNHLEMREVKGKELCQECYELLEYSRKCTARCPFMKTKTFCSNCKTHCYSKEMREKIKAVMMYAGPRMLLRHPLMTLWHLVCSLKEKLSDKRRI